AAAREAPVDPITHGILPGFYSLMGQVAPAVAAASGDCRPRRGRGRCLDTRGSAPIPRARWAQSPSHVMGAIATGRLARTSDRRPRSGAGDPAVLEMPGLIIDADLGSGDPGREFAPLPARQHQARDELAIGLGGEPLVLAGFPLLLAQHLPRWRGVNDGE